MDLKKYLSIAAAEREYNLPKDTIRRDIFREANRTKKRFIEGDYQKIGRDWFITKSAVERVYKALQK